MKTVGRHDRRRRQNKNKKPTKETENTENKQTAIRRAGEHLRGRIRCKYDRPFPGTSLRSMSIGGGPAKRQKINKREERERSQSRRGNFMRRSVDSEMATEQNYVEEDEQRKQDSCKKQILESAVERRRPRRRGQVQKRRPPPVAAGALQASPCPIKKEPQISPPESRRRRHATLFGP